MKTENSDRVIRDPSQFIKQLRAKSGVKPRAAKPINRERLAAQLDEKRKEAASVDEIVNNLKAMGCEPVKNPGGVTSQRGRPDIEVLIRFEQLPFAVLFSIEVKRATGGRLTKQQQYRIDRIIRQGGVAFVATNWAEVEQAIKRTQEHVVAWFEAMTGQEGL